MSHVYVPTTPITATDDAEEPPFKLCGKGPGGEHRELETLDPKDLPDEVVQAIERSEQHPEERRPFVRRTRPQEDR